MMQIWFLSVLLNIVVGLLLLFTHVGTKNSGEDLFYNHFMFRCVCGILSIFIGLMKFIAVSGNDLPVVGDLLPALTGIIGGVSLLFEYMYIQRKISFSTFFQVVFISKRKYIGLMCIVAGLLHFLFFSVPIV